MALLLYEEIKQKPNAQFLLHLKNRQILYIINCFTLFVRYFMFYLVLAY